jgi:hypothetical protein
MATRLRSSAATASAIGPRQRKHRSAEPGVGASAWAWPARPPGDRHAATTELDDRDGHLAAAPAIGEAQLGAEHALVEVDRRLHVGDRDGDVVVSLDGHYFGPLSWIAGSHRNVTGGPRHRTAVDGVFGAGDERAVVAREEHDELCNFTGLATTAGRKMLEPFVEIGLLDAWTARHHRGVDRAGMDGIDADAVASELDPRRCASGPACPTSPTVRTVIREAGEARGRRDVDDRSASGSAHGLDCSLDAEKRAEEIDAPNLFEAVGRLELDRSRPVMAALFTNTRSGPIDSAALTALAQLSARETSR